jgi:hypothetical protein
MTEREKILDKVRKLKIAFEAGLIPRLAQHEVNPGLPKDDRIHYIYFTLPVAINFQRNSPAMWASALKTFEDPETNYLFYPEKVVLLPREKIQADLVKHKLALQKNKHVDIWIRLSETLNKYYENDPRVLLASKDYDVAKLLELIRITRKKDFPYLSGTKISNYWLYILSSFTDIRLKNINLVSVIPDTHIIQASKVLAITEENDKPEIVAQKWFELLGGSEISPVEMHPVLWNWSRAKFRPEV